MPCFVHLWETLMSEWIFIFWIFFSSRFSRRVQECVALRLQTANWTHLKTFCMWFQINRHQTLRVHWKLCENGRWVNGFHEFFSVDNFFWLWTRFGFPNSWQPKKFRWFHRFHYLNLSRIELRIHNAKYFFRHRFFSREILL